MALTTEQIEQLWTSHAYRDWLKKWWDEDFSISGCEKKGIQFPGGEPIEFAGRKWDVFRVPFHDKDGARNLSASGDRRELATILKQQLDNSPAFDARGVLCPRALQASRDNRPTYLNVSSAAFFSELEIAEANLEAVDFSNALFLKSVAFRHCRFGNFKADGATFDAGLALRGKIFGDARFSETKINGPFATDDAAFQELSLENSRLRDGLRFDRATALQKLNAKGLICDGDISIVGSALASTALIDLSKAEGGALLISAGGANHTQRDLRLTASRFSSVSLRSTQVVEFEAQGIEVAEDMIFEDSAATSALMSTCAISGKLVGHGGHLSLLDLSNSRIGSFSWNGGSIGSILLADTQLGSFETIGTNVRSALGTNLICDAPFVMKNLFVTEMQFNAATFKMGLTVQLAKDAQIANSSFDGASFCNGVDGVCADFSGVEFSGKVSFYRAKFVGIPQFHSVGFHENLSFQSADFQPFAALPAEQNEKDRRLATAERAFRSLRRRMEEMRNNQDARRFHAFEMRARRYRSDKDVGLSERVSSWLYEHVSSYGDSIARPFQWWSGLFVVMTFFYWICANQINADGLAHAASYSLQQVFRPFSAWDIARTPTDAWTKHLFTGPVWFWPPAWAPSIRLAASFQAIASLTLLFLFGLALRRRFQVS